MNDSSSLVTASIRIEGMTCASCSLLLERAIKGVPGIHAVSVNHRTGIAELQADAAHPPFQRQIEAAVRDAGYRLTSHEQARARSVGSLTPEWHLIGGSMVVIVALYFLLRGFHLIDVLPSANAALSYGGSFVIGLVAGTTSCLAVTGGLLLAVAAQYHQRTSASTSWQRLQPLLHFNVGRLISYFFLGGVVGLLGQSLVLGARTTAIVNLLVALLMLVVALRILHLIPSGWMPFEPPRWLSRRVASIADSGNPAAPLLLGALTFFLPCGFTQSLQLVALASGNFLAGALTMFFFALGTLPSLLGISILTSASKGQTSRLFMQFAGTLVLLLSFYNLNSALVLNGIDLSSLLAPSPTTAGAAPTLTDGVQVVRMAVTPYGYEPSTLTIRSGIPVHWIINGTQATGCTSGIVVPSLSISRTLQAGDNIIDFTAPRPGRLPFSCSMGMVRGTFNVL